MQADDAEQATAGISRLRGRKPRETSEDVRSQMGVRFYASRSSGQVSVISFRVFCMLIKRIFLDVNQTAELVGLTSETRTFYVSFCK